jgi:hypothetical protein
MLLQLAAEEGAEDEVSVGIDEVARMMVIGGDQVIL